MRMADQGTRVALLAREGQARERLEQALLEAGAKLVATADPTSGSADEVAAAAPQAVLVALEPAIEDALDGWNGLLSDPGITVIYDEAELAANREGWDAARWIRHLRAKLNRHDDVLPPRDAASPYGVGTAQPLAEQDLTKRGVFVGLQLYLRPQRTDVVLAVPQLSARVLHDRVMYVTVSHCRHHSPCGGGGVLVEVSQALQVADSGLLVERPAAGH